MAAVGGWVRQLVVAKKDSSNYRVALEVRLCCDCRRANKTWGARRLLERKNCLESTMVVEDQNWSKGTPTAGEQKLLEGHNDFWREKKC